MGNSSIVVEILMKHTIPRVVPPGEEFTLFVLQRFLGRRVKERGSWKFKFSRERHLRVTNDTIIPFSFLCLLVKRADQTNKYR